MTCMTEPIITAGTATPTKKNKLFQRSWLDKTEKKILNLCWFEAYDNEKKIKDRDIDR